MLFTHCGCKVNQYETNAMIQQFEKNGDKIVPFQEKADIYIINTCTVTNMSDRKSRQILRRAKQLNPKSIIVAVGCYAQVGKKELEQMEEIDLILGNNEKTSIVSCIEEYITSKQFSGIKVEDIMKQVPFLDFGTITHTDKTRAVIKIQDGCDRFCSYCIIPYARGRVRSREAESVKKEITYMVQRGIKEIVITGIHIASYGKEFKQQYQLIDLLEEINSIPDLKRIRLSSIEPTIITKEFITRLGKLEKICDHFHLSLQSGCDETLKRMNRRYTTEQFEKACELIREEYPQVCLTTDIIVGFPGETEQEFQATYEFLKKIGFYKMHIFPYSQRKGTKAAVMPNQVNPKKKEERSHKLIELSSQMEKDILKKYMGKTVEVLFENKEGAIIKGHMKNYILVKVKGNLQENTIQKVKVIDTQIDCLVGNAM